MRIVDPKLYSKKYFETDCGGHEAWRSSCGRILPPRLEYSFKIAAIEPGMKVLDFGCGRGELSYQAANAGAHVIGVDYAKDALLLTDKLPRDTKGSMKFAIITSLILPYKDNSFDRILFIDVIEHMYPEQLSILMQEFARVLKKGGKLVIHTFPNLDHYNFGYPYFTRVANFLINPLWQIVFKEKLRDLPSPRFGYDKEVHVNECSLTMVKQYVELAHLKAKVWYDSSWRMIRLRDKIRYTLLQPLWLSLKYFADDIWCIATK